MPALVRRILRRKAITGAVSGSNVWTVVTLIGVARAVVRRLAGPPDEVVYRHRLEPGDVLVISERGEEVAVDQG